jgi:dihydroneopterin aldolase
MGTVKLEGMEFFAYHGFYEEERRIGNKYSVSLTVKTKFKQAAEHDDLGGTVNYEVLYAITKEEMAVPSKLLEHVAQRIADRIYTAFPRIQKLSVHISKFNPPIGGVCKAATIVYKRKTEKQRE